MQQLSWSAHLVAGLCAKVRHFGEIRRNSRVPYEDMIFFDDWDQNCKDVEKLGVTCVECRRVSSEKRDEVRSGRETLKGAKTCTPCVVWGRITTTLLSNVPALSLALLGAFTTCICIRCLSCPDALGVTGPAR